MRLHCYQASQRPNMTTDRPPLAMAHTDLGIGPNISKCVQKV